MAKSNESKETTDMIISLIYEGNSRECAAKAAGFNRVKSMMQYMRRKGFRWDGREENFVPREESQEKKKAAINTAPDKIQAIIDDLTVNKLDPKESASKHGFKDHITMSQYLKDKGFVWDSEKETYINTNGADNIEEEFEKTSDDDTDNAQNAPENEKPALRAGENLEEYLPLLKLLKENEEMLKELIENKSLTGELPRYTIPGRKINKAIYMTMDLESLIISYSKEKNVSQTEILKIALVEFFLKYGYEAEIKALLEK